MPRGPTTTTTMTMPSEGAPSISRVCLLLAILAGVMKTLEAVVLTFPAQRARKQNYELSARMKFVSVAANLALSILEVAAKIRAVGTGPVAIVTPVIISTNLLSNMMIQPLLGIASYSDNSILGTLILGAAASMLVDVGPADIDPEQNVLDLVTSHAAIIFLSAMVIVVAVGISILACKLITKNVFLVFVYAGLGETASVVGTSLSKIAQCDVSITVRVTAIILYCCFGIIPTVTGARANAELDDPALFIPIGAGANLLLTALSGLLLWNDGQRLTLPFAYAMISTIVVLSVYLVSKDDLLGVTKVHVAEAHVAKIKSMSAAARKKIFLRGARRAADGAKPALGYTDHDLHPHAPRGRLARTAARLPEQTSELAGRSDVSEDSEPLRIKAVTTLP